MDRNDSCQRGRGKREWWKEGEEINQRTCMNDPCTWTTVWGLTVGARAWAGWRKAKGKKLETPTVNKNKK